MTQSVAQAQTELKDAQDAANTSKAAMEDAAAVYKAAMAKRDAALAAMPAGAEANTPEYKAYAAAKLEVRVARDASIEANNVYANDLKEVARAKDALTAAQKTADSAAANTAATANANTENDTKSSATTATAPVADAPKPLSKSEEKKITETKQPETAVIAKPTNAGAGRGSYAGYNAADEVKNKAALAVGNNKTATISEIPNPLDELQSYTYGLTLFALTKSDFNSMVDDPLTFTPKKALISSAGRYQDVRDQNFKEDFYFDSFKLTTVIGLNANARGTNAINMDFTIIEPFGMTLLDRIMNVSMNELAAKNYLDIPYLLRLEFFGVDDQGNLKKMHEHTKNFPIKLVGFKIKASVKGAEYAIQAVPFNHGANLESIQAIKTRLEVTADTVKTFFDSTEDVPKTNNAQSDSTRNASAYLYQSGQAGAGGGRGSARDPRILGETPPSESVAAATKPTSFTSAYNAWNIAASKNNDPKFADQIQFVIDKDIANSKIADPKSTSVKRSGESNPNKEAKSQDGKAATTLDTSKVVHSFEAGTTVNEIINAILPNSEFFLKQVKDPSKDSKSPVQDGAASDATVKEQANTLKMWKIIPSIKLSDFDPERNVWGKNITFYIKQYDAYQQRDPRLPKSPPPKAVKRYDYFYTGKNSSVINFDIDFNALYFTAAQIDRGNTEATAGAQARPESSNEDGSTSVGGKSGFGSGERKVNTGSQMQTGVGGSNNRSETQNAQSALQSIYTSAAGDMINLKLQIIGDPHFIKQDDLYLPPSMTAVTSGGNTTFVSPSVQSLSMDSGEIYCYVSFKTPADFNDATGMYDLNSSNKFHTSEFSGYYKVITVDSEFRQGKFIQTLNLVRYPMQDSPNVSAAQNSSALDNKRNEKATAAQKGAPAAQTEKPTVTPETVPDKKPSLTGPDKDGSTTEKAPVKVYKEAELNKPVEVAEVAKNGETKTIEEATSKTGESPIAPPDNKQEKAQKVVSEAITKINDIKATNEGLQTRMADLTSQNASLRAQIDALDNVENPTPEQTAQRKELSNQISSNTKERTMAYDQYKSNINKAMDIGVNANQAASNGGISGIQVTAGFIPATYDPLNPPTSESLEIK